MACFIARNFAKLDQVRQGRIDLFRLTLIFRADIMKPLARNYELNWR